MQAPRMFGSTVILAVLLGACGAVGETSALDRIPRAAANAIRAQAGTAEIMRVDTEGRGGEIRYEAGWKEDGMTREVKVTATGRLVELEKELRPDQVPVAVRTGAVRALPAEAVISYVLLMDGTYEAEAVVGGREHEATFATDGTPRVNDEDDKDDDEDEDHDDDERD